MIIVKKEEINNLVFYDNLKIIQNKDYFKFSIDSILLPNFVFVPLNKDCKILDMCTGNAPIPLILSKKYSCSIVGVEIQEEIYDLAVKTIKLNNLNNRIKIIKDDVKNIKDYYDSDTFDLITCNPPYFKTNNGSIINSNKIKTIARHEKMINIEEIISISKKLLKNNGSLSIINRTERMIEIIELMRKYNIEPKRIQLIYPKIGKESNLFMIDGRKNGREGLKILPPLYVHNNDNTYTKDVLKMFGKDLI